MLRQTPCMLAPSGSLCIYQGPPKAGIDASTGKTLGKQLESLQSWVVLQGLLVSVMCSGSQHLFAMFVVQNDPQPLA